MLNIVWYLFDYYIHIHRNYQDIHYNLNLQFLRCYNNNYMNHNQKGYYDRKEKSSAKGSANQILDANQMIMVYKDTYKSKFKSMYYTKPDYISLGCALENMSLESVNLGLGSCIVCDTLYIAEEINNYLNITGYEQVCGFILGYPIYDEPQKSKKDIKDLLL